MSNAPPEMVPSVIRPWSTARSRRRTRLRTTADPTARGTAKATRGGSAPESSVEFPDLSTVPAISARYTRVSGPLLARRPWRAKAAKVARSRMRQIRPIAGHGRAGDGHEECGGRPWSTCGAETRGAGPDVGCWVGRSSSRIASSMGVRAHRLIRWQPVRLCCRASPRGRRVGSV